MVDDSKAHTEQNILTTVDVGEPSRTQSPAGALPLEILFEIFSLAVDTNVVLGRRGVRRLGAISLSSVCVKWRTAALSLPGIWARITLYFPPKRLEERKLQKAKRYLEALLERSGKVQLEVVIEFHRFVERVIEGEGEDERAVSWMYHFKPLLELLVSRP
ncbi:hypothetical protein PM082_021914 [Marasmius tenuissimus]|nr:hypothetical protein PM082_021914 [Marasmius tenuissimus]